MQSLSSALRRSVPCALLSLLLATSPSLAGEGSLGIFEDSRATSCNLSISPGATRTFYVVFAPDGSTRGGIYGMEFQVNAQSANGYMVMNEALTVQGIKSGNVLSGGATMGFGECKSGVTIPIVRFEVMNLGNGDTDAPLFVGAKSPPSNQLWDCPLANLCDNPIYTAVCVAGGVGVLNAGSDVACGSGAQKKKWSRVKALYR